MWQDNKELLRPDYWNSFLDLKQKYCVKNLETIKGVVKTAESKATLLEEEKEKCFRESPFKTVTESNEINNKESE